VAGHHRRRCVPARRLKAARTKPGRQSECAASWLDKDGNSCGRGCCFLVRAWRAVTVGRSYRRAPLPTHKSCPIPPTLIAALLAHVSRRSLPTCTLLSLRCLSLESTLRWTLGSRAIETPTVSGLSQLPTALTCLPYQVRQPTGADFARSLLQHKQAKRYIRGPASWHPPRLSSKQPATAILWEVSNRPTAIRREVCS
jgi:hypothetical protein